MGRNIVFNTYGNDKQKLACQLWLDDHTRDIVYGGSKGSGKSYLGVSLIFGNAFLYPKTHYFIARKSLTNIRKFTIPSINEVFEHWGITKSDWDYNGQDNFYELYNGSRVYLLDARYQPSDEKYTRFGSMQMTQGWIEEAGEFEESAKNNLNASIGRWRNIESGLKPKLLQTCNPQKNYLYREYYKKYKTGELENWKAFIQALPNDNKRLPPDYLDNLEKTLSYEEKQRLLYGNWEYDDDPAALIDYDSILGIFKEKTVKTGTKYITCDVARYGRDSSVVMVWDGFKVIYLKQYAKNSITDLADIIKGLREKYNVPQKNVIVDEDGVGGGLVDILKCKGFVNNSSPIYQRNQDAEKVKENYANLKSQCYFKLAERIKVSGIYISAPISLDEKDAIIEELEQVKQRDIDTEGKRAVVSKETVRDNIGRSPDYSDCLMMREYFELAQDIKVNIRRNFK